MIYNLIKSYHMTFFREFKVKLIKIKWLKKAIRKLFDLFLLTNCGTPPITTLAIEINEACNRKCDWCPNSKNQRKNGFIDEEIFYKIIDQMAEIKFVGRVTFNQYNEPLLDNRLPKFIRYVRQKLSSSYIYLNTNGDFINIELWTLLRKEGLDYVNISQYDGKINQNIKKVLESLDNEEKKHFGVHIFDTSKINNRAGLVNTTSKLPLKKFCFRPFSQLCVTYEGKVVLCCNDYFGQIEIGDVKTTPIKEIWENEIFVRYRKELKKGNRADLELCKTCDA
ncbi:S-adenosyl-L-methionine-dependent 2-deoxy-scyllo-inosamine dehydrogenase [Planktothrix tepida]|uniref:Putative Radical SAM domain protein n=1 Tax=Planktothrix tepida PCC 9214 TaxID=671072 RepID=A0A1J1LUA0_9CYAN|nr:radical SAM/SPASM domain-containing protein [Planktothrix tepida]CAD5990010.1 S-adenosyl-L-methionine-dependent 2-deoxy-scyllo-inosamine dehydrogenase [Planktothrix tepida]CUR35594.1 putative Radical SAM domain protein [Planktothrix tepida PCC 9214]